VQGIKKESENGVETGSMGNLRETVFGVKIVGEEKSLFEGTRRWGMRNIKTRQDLTNRFAETKRRCVIRKEKS